MKTENFNKLITGGSILMILGFVIKKVMPGKKEQPTIMISTTQSEPTVSLNTKPEKKVFDTLGV